MAITVMLPSGQRVSTDADTMLIGRDSRCQLSMANEGGLQPQHAKIRRIANRWIIESLGDWLIQVGTAPPGRKDWIKPGDTIMLSEHGPRIVFEPAATTVPTSPVPSPIPDEPPPLPWDSPAPSVSEPPQIPSPPSEEPPPLPWDGSASPASEPPPPIPPVPQDEPPPLPWGSSVSTVSEPPPIPPTPSEQPPPLPWDGAAPSVLVAQGVPDLPHVSALTNRISAARRKWGGLTKNQRYAIVGLGGIGVVCLALFASGNLGTTGGSKRNNAGTAPLLTRAEVIETLTANGAEIGHTFDEHGVTKTQLVFRGTLQVWRQLIGEPEILSDGYDSFIHANYQRWRYRCKDGPLTFHGNTFTRPEDDEMTLQSMRVCYY